MCPLLMIEGIVTLHCSVSVTLFDWKYKVQIKTAGITYLSVNCHFDAPFGRFFFGENLLYT